MKERFVYSPPCLIKLSDLSATFCGTGSSAAVGAATTTMPFCQDGGGVDTNPGGAGNGYCVTGGNNVAAGRAGTSCVGGGGPATPAGAGNIVSTCISGSTAASEQSSTGGCSTGGDA